MDFSEPEGGSGCRLAMGAGGRRVPSTSAPASDLTARRRPLKPTTLALVALCCVARGCPATVTKRRSGYPPFPLVLLTHPHAQMTDHKASDAARLPQLYAGHVYGLCRVGASVARVSLSLAAWLLRPAVL